jgi:hypothetical protein
MRRYAIPVDQTGWKIPGTFDTMFNWEYNSPRENLLTLYEKGKERQWNGNTRIDWSLDLDPENPIRAAGGTSRSTDRTSGRA